MAQTINKTKYNGEKLTDKEICEIIDKHRMWLEDEAKGERADFSGANLTGVEFCGVNLKNANFYKATLDFANFRDSKLAFAEFINASFANAVVTDCRLTGTIFYDSDLTGCSFENVFGSLLFHESNLYQTIFFNCNLRHSRFLRANINNTIFDSCNLFDCDFTRAVISNIYLNGTNLSKARLSSAKIKEAEISYDSSTAFYNLTCPEEGSFIGFKKVLAGENAIIAKLLITEDAKRSSATSRKCRASKVKVLGFYDNNRKELKNVTTALPMSILGRRYSVEYKVGEIIEVENFDENRWNECSTGIHFFITFDEAVKYERY